MACVLCGNTSFPLDSKETAFFYQMEKSDIEIIIVDLNTLYSDIDLTPFKKVKVVLTFGSNTKYKLAVHPNFHVHQIEESCRSMVTQVSKIEEQMTSVKSLEEKEL